MPVEIKITLDQNAAAIVERVRTMPQWMAAGISRALDKENELTVGFIDQTFLSFPKDGPTTPIGCRVISGRLRGSVRASKATAQGERIVSAIGSNVVYAAVQEFGFQGDVTVRPHTRKKFEQEEIFGKRRKVRKGDIGVRSFTRHMDIQGRGFVQAGIAHRASNYTASISQSIVDGWNQNK